MKDKTILVIEDNELNMKLVRSLIKMSSHVMIEAGDAETGIKLARKWGYEKKGIPDNKAEIIVCCENFHGRTTTIVGFSSDPDAYMGYGPSTPGFVMIPFDDTEALEAAINENTAAFLVEPIQGEAGVKVPSEGYLREVRRICSENNVMLMFDEVQTGFCRTGKRFCWIAAQIASSRAVGKGRAKYATFQNLNTARRILCLPLTRLSAA